MPEAFLGDELQTNKSWPRMINAGVQRFLGPVSEATGAFAKNALNYGGGALSLGYNALKASGVIKPETSEAIEQGVEHAGQSLPRLALQAGASYVGQRFHIPALSRAALGDVALQQWSDTDENAPFAQKVAQTALGTAAFHYAPKIGEGA